MAAILRSRTKRFEGVQALAQITSWDGWWLFKLENGSWCPTGSNPMFSARFGSGGAIASGISMLSRRIKYAGSRLSDKDVECILSPIECLAWLTEETTT